MKRRKQLIIGCGTAALSALKQIRKVGSEDEVKLITMENHPPYSPMSLPYVVSERVRRSDIQMVDDDFFRQMDATLLRNRSVLQVDPGNRNVTYDNGEGEGYDRLLIATGSDPIVPPMLKAAGCFGFHVMDDCLNVIDQLKNKRRVGILGAGLVAMELAVALKERGCQVTVIAPRERILRRYFDTEASRRIIGLFAEHGVTNPSQLGRGHVRREIRGRDSRPLRPGSRIDNRHAHRRHRGHTEGLFLERQRDCDKRGDPGGSPDENKRPRCFCSRGCGRGC